ncbi:MAG: DUF5714 domain-containing protein [Christensenellaceae bacterium]|jgi:hypothetical protein
MLHKVNLLCPICHGEKTYFEETDEMNPVNCYICSASFLPDSVCKNGHYVCHMCRQKNARKAIMKYCLRSKEKQPYRLLKKLMQLPEVAMHGPEHHFLLPAALLTTYCNEKEKKEALLSLLEEANARSIEVPGGACGYYGICGAAIGAGIYTSILSETDPYSEAEWKALGLLTAEIGREIAQNGGPRCCKRNAFLALPSVIMHSNQAFATHFTSPKNKTCIFYSNNEECKRKACAFFPSKS